MMSDLRRSTGRLQLGVVHIKVVSLSLTTIYHFLASLVIGNGYLEWTWRDFKIAFGHRFKRRARLMRLSLQITHACYISRTLRSFSELRGAPCRRAVWSPLLMQACATTQRWSIRFKMFQLTFLSCDPLKKKKDLSVLYYRPVHLFKPSSSHLMWFVENQKHRALLWPLHQLPEAACVPVSEQAWLQQKA